VRGGGNDGCCCAGGAVRDCQVVMVVGSCCELGEGVRSNGCRGGACDSGGCYRVVGTGGGDEKKFHGACQPLHRFGSGWRRLASSGHAVTWVFSCSLALCILCSLVFLFAGFHVVLLADFVAEATPELQQLCWGFLQSRADLCSFLLLSMTIFFCFMACFFFGS